MSNPTTNKATTVQREFTWTLDRYFHLSLSIRPHISLASTITVGFGDETGTVEFSTITSDGPSVAGRLLPLFEEMMEILNTSTVRSDEEGG